MFSIERHFAVEDRVNRDGRFTSLALSCSLSFSVLQDTRYHGTRLALVRCFCFSIWSRELCSVRALSFIRTAGCGVHFGNYFLRSVGGIQQLVLLLES